MYIYILPQFGGFQNHLGFTLLTRNERTCLVASYQLDQYLT
jgi:hypothetical protein